MKCKILYWQGKKPEKVEDLLNEWLESMPNIEIVAVTQQPNFAYTIFYKES